jgi:hypothetical protein
LANPALHDAQSSVLLKFKGQTEQFAPTQLERHVQLQPVRVLPVTESAFELQLAAGVQVRTQAGNESKPASQLPQSSVAFTLDGHWLQSEPHHADRQLQLHVGSSPETASACEEQSSVSVHTLLQRGKPAKPLSQEPQSSLAFTNTGQKEQFAPIQLLRHVQLQPVRVLPCTLTALPLQFAPTVHVRKQAGYVS